MQTKKLRIVVNPRGWIVAWFPGEELDGKLFHGMEAWPIIEFMYRRWLRKQLFKLL